MHPLPWHSPPQALVEREPYLVSPQLAEAVNIAIALGRPLLLQGDPGAGKTRLAHAVAYALGMPLEEVYIKSTSRGQDLLYTFDAVRRLYDVQTGPPAAGAAAHDIRRYIRLGPLGRAIARASFGRPSVVLIDEIDKADIDFPNDLLQEIDRLTFEIPEVAGLRYAVDEDQPGRRPIIIVTNNEEKTLPGAFLRRCVFHHVTFPADEQALDQILSLHDVQDSALRAEAIRTVLRLREEIDLERKPGLSELLDWAVYLQAAGTPLAEVSGLPHTGALLKHHADLIRVADEWNRTA